MCSVEYADVEEERDEVFSPIYYNPSLLYRITIQNFVRTSLLNLWKLQNILQMN